MKYKLEVSYDAGTTYKVEMESNNLDDFSRRCLELDNKLLRWAIKDEENNIIRSCAIHNEIIGALNSYQER